MDNGTGFDFIGQQNSVIKNKKALDIDYIPDNMLYREKEMERIKTEVYKPSYLYDASTNLMVYGDPGTGKTAIIRKLDNEFNTVLQQNDEENKDKIKTIYINCEGNDSPKAFFQELMSQLGVDYSNGGTISENAQKLVAHISNKKLNTIIIMDEADSLDKRNYLNKVLYRLTRPSEIYDGFEGTISIIAVSNDINIKQSLNDSVNSTFGGKKITFDSYTRDQIIDILNQRQDIALKEKIFTEKNLKKIASTVEEDFSGDIRKGIEIMSDVIYKHGEQKLLQNGEKMSEILEETIERIKRRDIEEFMSDKDLHYLLVMWAYIESFEEAETQFNPIYERYKKLCKYARESLETEKGKSHMYVRRRLDEMDENNIINKHVDRIDKGTVSNYTPLISFYILKDAVESKMEKEGYFEKLHMGKMRYSEENELTESEEKLLEAKVE